MEEFKMETKNEELIRFFDKSPLFKKFLMPKNNEEYKKIEEELIKGYGREEIKRFNKLVIKEMKEKGLL